MRVGERPFFTGGIEEEAGREDSEVPGRQSIGSFDHTKREHEGRLSQVGAGNSKGVRREQHRAACRVGPSGLVCLCV